MTDYREYSQQDDGQAWTPRICPICGYVARAAAFASSSDVLDRHRSNSHPAHEQRARAELKAQLIEADYRVPCVQDPEQWFPDKGGSAETPKRFCRDYCEVREACLNYALAANESDGIWGGTTPNERRTMKAAKHER